MSLLSQIDAALLRRHAANVNRAKGSDMPSKVPSSDSQPLTDETATDLHRCDLERRDALQAAFNRRAS